MIANLVLTIIFFIVTFIVTFFHILIFACAFVRFLFVRDNLQNE